MKKQNIILFIILFVLYYSDGLSQSNLIRNGSFESHYGYVPYPDETIYEKHPPEWIDFTYNPGGENRWFTDSICSGHPDSCSYTQKAKFRNVNWGVDGHTEMPWEAASLGTMQLAQEGSFFIGIDPAANTGPLEGVQQYYAACPLNSGNYTVSLYASRAYLGGLYGSTDSKLKFFLNHDQDVNTKKVAEWHINGGDFVPGEWMFLSENFDLDTVHVDDRDNIWFAIRGNIDPFQNNIGKYTYIDNARLFRPCDLINDCSFYRGQICPSIITEPEPGIPLRINGISNATDLRIDINNGWGPDVINVHVHNENGLPDYWLRGQDFNGVIPAGNYEARMTITNLCGSLVKTEIINIADPSLYDTVAAWVNIGANWSRNIPPCCKDSLWFKNTSIVGIRDYIVSQYITVGPNVTIPSGSDIYMQAPDTITIGNIEVELGATWEVVLDQCHNRIGQFPDDVVNSKPSQSPPLDSLPSLGSNSLQVFNINPQQAGISVYPNPFTNELKVLIPDNYDAGTYSLKISDLIGRVVLIEDNLVSGENTFQTTTLSAGTYIYEIGKAKGRIIKVD